MRNLKLIVNPEPPVEAAKVIYRPKPGVRIIHRSKNGVRSVYILTLKKGGLK